MLGTICIAEQTWVKGSGTHIDGRSLVGQHSLMIDDHPGSLLGHLLQRGQAIHLLHWRQSHNALLRFSFLLSICLL